MKISPVPGVAIGGIKSKHVEEVVKAGAQGLAVVSAICGQLDPMDSARQLSCLWKLYSNVN